MIAMAKARYIRISPKKVRLVIDVIRGKGVDEALAVLMTTNKKASELVGEVVESAANNAQRKYPEKKYVYNDLYISKNTADEGPSLTRYRAASMGRAVMIKKRTSHIFVGLDARPERAEQAAKIKKKQPQKRNTIPKKVLAKAQK
jgi:large subunit ribosomal protein L22